MVQVAYDGAVLDGASSSPAVTSLFGRPSDRWAVWLTRRERHPFVDDTDRHRDRSRASRQSGGLARWPGRQADWYGVFDLPP
jgi:hypothetical protein